MNELIKYEHILPLLLTGKAEYVVWSWQGWEQENWPDGGGSLKSP